MKLWKDDVSKDSLWDVLGLDKVAFPCVMAIVGSGGKTSLMGQLAKEGKEHNLRVAVTTTTHIRKPPEYQEVFSRMEKGTVKVFGKECKEEKISYPGDSCYNEICKDADLILVEADGSRGLPVKYPAEYEPVIPENAAMILCVCGMSALGRQAKEVCHRWELAQEAGAQEAGAQEAGTLITVELLSRILEKGYGEPFKRNYPRVPFFYCMNQADTKERQEAAGELLKNTRRKGIVVSLKKKRLAMIYMASGSGQRYGANKLLEPMAAGALCGDNQEPVEHRPLYSYGLEALKKAAAQLKEEQGTEADIIVVSRYEEILKGAGENQCVPVYNPNSQKGITASIHLGVETADMIWKERYPAEAEPIYGENAVYENGAFLFAVADQPWLKAESISRLVEEFYQSDKTIACLTDGVKNGNPVIFSGKYREALVELQGDKGGSVILKKHPEEVLKVRVGEKELKDIDYRSDRGEKQEG